MGSEGFSETGLNTNRITDSNKSLLGPHTEERTRNMHAVWPVTDASDRADVDMKSLLILTDLDEEVTDTVETARVLAAPRTPTKTEREENERLTCRIALGVDAVSWVEDWRDVT